MYVGLDILDDRDGLVFQSKKFPLVQIELRLPGPALAILSGLVDEHHDEGDERSDLRDHHFVVGVEEAIRYEGQSDRPPGDHCHGNADRSERSEKRRHVGVCVTRLVMDSLSVAGRGLLLVRASRASERRRFPSPLPPVRGQGAASGTQVAEPSLDGTSKSYLHAGRP